MKKAFKLLSLLMVCVLILVGVIYVTPSNVSADDDTTFNTLSNDAGILLNSTLSSSDTATFASNVNKYVLYKYPVGSNFNYSYLAYNPTFTRLIFYVVGYNDNSLYTVNNTLNALVSILSSIPNDPEAAISSVTVITNVKGPYLITCDLSYSPTLGYSYSINSSRMTVDVSSYLNLACYYYTTLVNSYMIYLNDSEIYDDGYNHGYATAQDYYVDLESQAFDGGYTEGYDDATDYYADLIEDDYTNNATYNAVLAQRDQLLAESDADLNLSFFTLLKNIIDYPIDFVKNVFTYKETKIVNGVTTTTYVPYEIFGVSIANFVLGLIAISLTFAIIGVVRRVWR